MELGWDGKRTRNLHSNKLRYLFELNQQSPLLQWFFEMAFVFPLFAQNIFLIVTMLIPVIHGVRSDVCIKRNSTIMNDCIDRMRQKNSEKVCKHWWWTTFINISWNEWFGMCKCLKQIRYNEQRRTRIISGKVRLTTKFK